MQLNGGIRTSDDPAGAVAEGGSNVVPSLLTRLDGVVRGLSFTPVDGQMFGAVGGRRFLGGGGTPTSKPA